MSETKALAAPDEVCITLLRQQAEFARALPIQITAERFIRVAQTAVRNNPSLADLDRASLYGAFHKCAADGLLPDGREAVIIGRKGVAVYMPMVQGICKKARNSGEIKSLNAILVFKNDEYDHWIDETGEHFKHRPSRGERGEHILTYAYAQIKDGGIFFEEVDMEQMRAIEKQANDKFSAWQGPFRTEMMRKSTLRRLLKYRVPSSTDLDSVVRADDEMYMKPEEQERKPAEPISSRLRNIVETTAEPSVKSEPPLATLKDDMPI